MSRRVALLALGALVVLLAPGAIARPIFHPVGGDDQQASKTNVVQPVSAAWPRPPHQDGARMARWLAHVTEYGTLATVGRAAEFPVVGGSVSHSDGAVDAPSGRIFFYLTPMDELTQNLQVHPTASYTLTEAQVVPGGCGSHDPEDPVCAKATFLGKVVRVVGDRDLEAARAAMFGRHPAMASWPPAHAFAMYELQVQQVHLLDFYGGMKIIDHAEYYAADLQPASTAA